jgi:hypothetical protein
MARHFSPPLDVILEISIIYGVCESHGHLRYRGVSLRNRPFLKDCRNVGFDVTRGVSGQIAIYGRLHSSPCFARNAVESR